MNSLLVVIRSILQNMIGNIDAGNSNLTDEECLEVLEQLRHFSNTKEKLSKYQACKYLNISRSTFDEYVKTGRLPKGRKQQGFKEIFGYKEDIIDFKNNR